MATFSQNQVKDIFVVEALAGETEINAFIAAADPLEVQILKADGSAQPAAGEDFYFVQKHADGSFKRSDVLPAGQIRYVNVINQKVPVLKSYAIEIPAIAGIDVGDVLQIMITLDNWGSRSFEDQYFKFANYKVQTGDDEEDIAEGLVTSLTRNFSREPGTLFTFDAVTDGLSWFVEITEVQQPFVTGKKQGLPLEFVVSNNFGGVQEVTNRVINPGSGRAIRDLEYFCKGNVGDSYRGAGYPHDFEQWFDSSLNKQYCLVHIGFWFEGLNHAVQKSEKEIIVVFWVNPADMNPVGFGNSVIALLETVTGLTLPDFVFAYETTTEATTEEETTT